MLRLLCCKVKMTQKLTDLMFSHAFHRHRHLARRTRLLHCFYVHHRPRPWTLLLALYNIQKTILCFQPTVKQMNIRSQLMTKKVKNNTNVAFFTVSTYTTDLTHGPFFLLHTASHASVLINC